MAIFLYEHTSPIQLQFKIFSSIPQEFRFHISTTKTILLISLIQSSLFKLLDLRIPLHGALNDFLHLKATECFVINPVPIIK